MRVVVLPGLDGTGLLLAEFCTAVETRGVPASVVGYPPDRPLDSGARAWGGFGNAMIAGTASVS